MTGDETDLYTVLGVPSTASPEEITHAFRRLVRSSHPDTPAASHNEADLRAVIAAYEVLRDPTRRAEYDRAHLPPPRPATPIRPARAAQEPAIRVGPVRYHGTTPPSDPLARLIHQLLTDGWW